MNDCPDIAEILQRLDEAERRINELENAKPTLILDLLGSDEEFHRLQVRGSFNNNDIESNVISIPAKPVEYDDFRENFNLHINTEICEVHSASSFCENFNLHINTNLREVHDSEEFFREYDEHKKYVEAHIESTIDDGVHGGVPGLASGTLPAALAAPLAPILINILVPLLLEILIDQLTGELLERIFGTKPTNNLRLVSSYSPSTGNFEVGLVGNICFTVNNVERCTFVETFTNKQIVSQQANLNPQLSIFNVQGSMYGFTLVVGNEIDTGQFFILNDEQQEEDINVTHTIQNVGQNQYLSTVIVNDTSDTATFTVDMPEPEEPEPLNVEVTINKVDNHNYDLKVSVGEEEDSDRLTLETTNTIEITETIPNQEYKVTSIVNGIEDSSSFTVKPLDLSDTAIDITTRIQNDELFVDVGLYIDGNLYDDTDSVVLPFFRIDYSNLDVTLRSVGDEMFIDVALQINDLLLEDTDNEVIPTPIIDIEIPELTIETDYDFIVELVGDKILFTTMLKINDDEYNINRVIELPELNLNMRYLGTNQNNAAIVGIEGNYGTEVITSFIAIPLPILEEHEHDLNVDYFFDADIIDDSLTMVTRLIIGSYNAQYSEELPLPYTTIPEPPELHLEINYGGYNPSSGYIVLLEGQYNNVPIQDDAVIPIEDVADSLPSQDVTVTHNIDGDGVEFTSTVTVNDSIDNATFKVDFDQEIDLQYLGVDNDHPRIAVVLTYLGKNVDDQLTIPIDMNIDLTPVIDLINDLNNRIGEPLPIPYGETVEPDEPNEYHKYHLVGEFQSLTIAQQLQNVGHIIERLHEANRKSLMPCVEYTLPQSPLYCANESGIEELKEYGYDEVYEQIPELADIAIKNGVNDYSPRYNHATTAWLTVKLASISDDYIKLAVKPDCNVGECGAPPKAEWNKYSRKEYVMILYWKQQGVYSFSSLTTQYIPDPISEFWDENNNDPQNYMDVWNNHFNDVVRYARLSDEESHYGRIFWEEDYNPTQGWYRDIEEYLKFKLLFDSWSNANVVANKDVNSYQRNVKAVPTVDAYWLMKVEVGMKHPKPQKFECYIVYKRPKNAT